MNQEPDHDPNSTRDDDAESAPPNKGQRAGARRAYLLPFLLLVVLAAILVSRMNSRQKKVGKAADGFLVSESGEAVRVEIDFGDGATRSYGPMAWREGMTVADVLKSVENHPHGIRARIVGEGERAMLIAIENAQNEGGGAEARNWVYEINGKRAPKSFAVYELRPSDTILWKFAVSRYNDSDSSDSDSPEEGE